MKTRRGNIVALVCDQTCEIRCARYSAGEIDFDDPKESCPRVGWNHQWHSTSIGVRSSDSKVYSPPQSREAMGRAAWLWLHTEATQGRLTLDRLEKEFLPRIPHFGCSCLREWKTIMGENFFRVNDQTQWAIDIHNVVNVKLNKPIWSPS